jgi:hypothetical protein
LACRATQCNITCDTMRLRTGSRDGHGDSDGTHIGSGSTPASLRGYERVLPVSATDSKRFPWLVQQRAAIHQETVGGQQGRNASVLTPRGHPTRLLHHQDSCRSSGFAGLRIVSPRNRGESTRSASDELSTAFGLADGFADLLRERSCGTLSDWLVKGESFNCPEM